MSLEALTEISRHYGSDSDYVIAGGGNTSYKDEDTLYVKGSGMALADMVPDAFVRIDRKALDSIWDKTYPAGNDEREREVLADLMAAKKPGEEHKRPSVETTLHGLLPFAFVVHLHPALVNGLSCSRQGEAAMREIFPQAIWVASINPGYILSLEVKKALEEYKRKNGRPAEIIFLQNHGVFVGAENTDKIKELYRDIMTRLKGKVKRQPDFGNESRELPGKAGGDKGGEIAETLAALARPGAANAADAASGHALFLSNNEISRLVENSDSFNPVSSAFTPDHIVYAGSDPLFTRAGTKAELEADWEGHLKRTGRPPKIVALQGLGVFGIGASERAALLALELFKDTVKVAVYSESFGGPLFMAQDKIDFINNWEVEAFRTRMAMK